MASAPPPAAAGANDQAYVQPRADWRVTLDGKDLTATLASRLISLTLTEKRGEETDTLELVLQDHDGRLELPPEGARLQVALGWKRGTGVAAGLVEKGSFVVDDLDWDGPPDKISLRASAADLTDSFRTRKSRIWKDTTVGAIISKVAGDNGLTPRCHPDLAGKQVKMIEQANKSDMAFLRDLGRRYDAVAAPKDRHLIFAPVDADTTATGKAIPTLKLTRQSGDTYRYSRAARERAQDGAEADWHDQGAATRKTAQKGGSKRRKLKRVYASEGDAAAAAQSETNRQKRAAASMEINLALGVADLAPGMRATLSGFKTEVDGRSWRVAEVTHNFNERGYRSSVKLDAAG